MYKMYHTLQHNGWDKYKEKRGIMYYLNNQLVMKHTDKRIYSIIIYHPNYNTIGCLDSDFFPEEIYRLAEISNV